MQKFLENIFSKISTSFSKSLKGEESLKNIIWYWGAIPYIFTFFILNRVIIFNDVKFIDLTICWLVLIYFSFHIYAVRKCAPKKPPLSEEEKIRLKKEAAKERTKRIFNKLISREPITKWNPVVITIVIDLLFIAHFSGYLLR